jgi:hypothetical protein
MEAMGQTLFNSKPIEMVSVLKAGGIRLLQEGGFKKDPDETVERIFIPLVKSAGGRTWLRDRAAETKTIVTVAESKTKIALKVMIDNMKRNGGEEKRHWAEVIEQEWSI